MILYLRFSIFRYFYEIADFVFAFLADLITNLEFEIPQHPLNPRSWSRECVSYDTAAVLSMQPESRLCVGSSVKNSRPCFYADLD